MQFLIAQQLWSKVQCLPNNKSASIDNGKLAASNQWHLEILQQTANLGLVGRLDVGNVGKWDAVFNDRMLIFGYTFCVNTG